jgi:hypothetical protein
MSIKAISQATIAAIALGINPGLKAANFSFKPAVHLDGITDGQYNYFMGNQSGDFNGDGLPDILALVQTNIMTNNAMAPEAWLYRNRGGAVLALPSRFPIVNAASGSAVADFNEDGVDDLVTGSSGTTSIATLLSNGHAGLVSGPSAPGPTTMTFHDVRAIDINHDGHADVLAWSGSTGYFDNARDLYAFYGDGTGHFSGPVALNVFSGSRRQVGSLWEDTILSDYSVADVNGDTYPDLIVGYEIRTWGSVDPDRYEGRVRIQKNNGSGLFLTPVDYPITSNFSDLAAGDFNGDGRTDIATTNFSVLQQSSTGGFAETSQIPGPPIPRMGLIATDLDGDNLDDAMLLHNGWDDYGWFLQRSGHMTGEWQSPEPYPLTGANYYRNSIAIADFMGDGCKDAAVAMDYSGLDLLQGQDCKVAAPHESVIVKDIDADGNGASDLLLSSESRSVFVTWYMAGAVRTAAHATAMPIGYRLVAAADFNGDRKTDLLWTSAANDLTLSIATTAGYVNQGLGINYGTGWSVVGAADINGNGSADIILRNDALGSVVVWYMQGPQRVAYAKHMIASGYRFVGAGDFNRDGRKDLVWTGPRRDVLFDISGSSGFAQAYLGLNYSVDYQLSTVMDIDGNGTSDLVLRSKRLGNVVNWFLVGTTRATYSSRTIGGSYRLVGKGDFNKDGRGDLAWVNDSNKVLLSFSTGSSYRNAYLPYPVGISYKLMDAR